MAAVLAQCVSCCGLTTKLNRLSLSPNAPFKPFSFSFNASTVDIFSLGLVSVCPVQLNPSQRSIGCEVETKKAESAAKRARQAEKRRVYNKAKKFEVRTRMNKVLDALEVLVKKQEAQPEEVIPVEKLIAEAYSVIDKAHIDAVAIRLKNGSTLTQPIQYDFLPNICLNCRKMGHIATLCTITGKVGMLKNGGEGWGTSQHLKNGGE